MVDAPAGGDPDTGGLLSGTPYATTGTEPELLKNWDFIGACYDALQIDPIDLEQGRKDYPAFDFSSFEPTKDKRATKPVGTIYEATPGGSFDRKVCQMSSMYDFKAATHLMGSVTVSDPTGAAFSSSLSASYTSTRQETEVNESIVTYTAMRTNLFALKVSSGDDAPLLFGKLEDALRALPIAPLGTSYEDFIQSFGTHYAQRVVFGGLATQRITVGRQDYESFLSEGLDLEAQFTATFEVAKADAKGSSGDQRDQRFKNAKSLEVDSIKFVGGDAVQTDFNMWSMYVKDEPGPASIDFEPIYSLLTADRLPGLDDVVARKDALRTATESYLSSHGEDTSNMLLQPGDRVALHPVDNRAGGLLAAGPAFVSVVASADPVPDAAIWAVDLYPQASTPSGGLAPRAIVSLRNQGTGTRLDAQAGRDSTYAPGEGLVGVSSTANAPGADQWVVTLVAAERANLVDGDYVQFQSRWTDDDGRAGFLWCDPQQPLSSRQVFSFGKHSQNGSIWRLSRVSAAS